MNSKTNHRVFILALILTLADSTCYNYWSGDTLPPNNHNASYCRSLLRWPVSDAVLADSATRDSTAIAYYQEIYKGPFSRGEVDLECLGMLQYMACAKAYPTCSTDGDSIETVCSWLCRLMEIRCGTDSKLYQEACIGNSIAETTCSWQKGLFLPLLLLLLFLVEF